MVSTASASSINFLALLASIRHPSGVSVTRSLQTVISMAPGRVHFILAAGEALPTARLHAARRRLRPAPHTFAFPRADVLQCRRNFAFRGDPTAFARRLLPRCKRPRPDASRENGCFHNFHTLKRWADAISAVEAMGRSPHSSWPGPCCKARPAIHPTALPPDDGPSGTNIRLDNCHSRRLSPSGILIVVRPRLPRNRC